MDDAVMVLELSASSPEFDEAYDILGQDIPVECLEERSFLRHRLRVRDEGPREHKERILVQDGYTLHLLAAMSGPHPVGAIYGHLISQIGHDHRGLGFVTYIGVDRSQRRAGVGSMLLAELRQRLERDSLAATGRPLVGMVYEIEEHGKPEIKGYLRTHGGFPLDITYYQPAVRTGASPERLQLWFQSFDPPVGSVEQARVTTYPARFVISLVTNLLAQEYVGPDLEGCDLRSTVYSEFRKSIDGRAQIGFIA